MTPEEREELRTLYIRVCKDSHFKMDFIKAAHFTAKVMSTKRPTLAIDVWDCFGYLGVMEEIATGKHSIVKGTK